MKRLPIPLVLVALALAACGPRSTPRDGAGPPPQVRVTEAQSGGSTGLGVGHRLVVELEANASTGFAWLLDEVGAAVLKSPEAEEYVPPEGDAVGASGLSIWRFEALAPGTTTLRMSYRQPFEEDATPSRTFTFTVAVGP